jgi:phosphoserine phosphatase
VRRISERATLCAIVTATNSFVTAPIAREFGVPHLARHRSRAQRTALYGPRRGIPCFREGKIARLEDWLGGSGARLQDFAQSASTATRTTTCPCSSGSRTRWRWTRTQKLAAVARARGWSAVSLRFP